VRERHHVGGAEHVAFVNAKSTGTGRPSTGGRPAAVDAPVEQRERDIVLARVGRRGAPRGCVVLIETLVWTATFPVQLTPIG
jgi:hypothetical protein